MTNDATTRIEPALDASTVDVERLEDLAHLRHWQAERHRPEDDVQILAAVLEVFQDRIDQRRVPERAPQQPEVPLVQLDPERLTLEMLQPSMPEEAIPVLADPGPDGRLTQVPAGLLALDPLEPLGLFLTALVQTQPGFGDEVDRGRNATI